MSIYATWLLFAVDGDAPPPLAYRGSHLNPADHHPRDGRLELAAIPDHCHPLVRDPALSAGASEQPAPLPVDFVRLSLTRPAATNEEHPASETTTVILDRSQVELLHRTLGEWLEADMR
ncbi:hypothetical protein [Kitasatospora albolonga]